MRRARRAATGRTIRPSTPPLRELDRIHQALLETAEAGWREKLSFWKKPEPVRGLYLWGGVGRGKTFLVDLFYDGLPIQQKYRTHFHRFMRGVHERLREHAGQSDPLAKIVEEWRDELRVLVLDEFFVTDIGDAMLLGRLLERMFAEGVALVTTSNTAPDNLYQDGLQRESFLPAIALLQEHCATVHAEGEEDYRLRALTRSPVYRTPLDASSDGWLGERWSELSGLAEKRGNIEIESRRIPVRGRGKSIVWFDFTALCEGPRGTSDYIEIAREFNTVLLGRHPRLRPQQRRRRAPLRQSGRRTLRPPRQPGLHRRDPADRPVFGNTTAGRLRAHRLAPDRDAERGIPGDATQGLDPRRSGPCTRCSCLFSCYGVLALAASRSNLLSL